MELPVHVCYCQIPKEELERIARLRYVAGVDTGDLMEQAKNDKEREYIAAVSLLDVDIADIPKLVPQNEPGLIQHLLDCHDHVIHILKQAGVPIPR
jgi:hypothetical protein